MTLKLNMLPPSVNNMSVRVFVRAAGLPFEEENVWGQTGSDEYKAKVPSGLTPSIEAEGLPRGAMWESCAVMMYLASREGLTNLYRLEHQELIAAEWGVSDNNRRAKFYTLSILYPLVARATYPRLSFSGYPGEVSTSDASDEGKESARKAAEDAIPAILEVYNQFFLADSRFIGGDEPSIADIRLASTLEFLAITDLELPGWLQEYMERVESTLGDAYSEPAADVRGYIAQATGEAVAS